MKKTRCFSLFLAFCLLAPFFISTTYVIKEGDVEVGRYSEEDGFDRTLIITDGDVMTTEGESVDPGERKIVVKGDAIEGDIDLTTDSKTIVIEGDHVSGVEGYKPPENAPLPDGGEIGEDGENAQTTAGGEEDPVEPDQEIGEPENQVKSTDRE